MLTYTQLRKKLDISKPRLDRWLAEGLPHAGEGKKRQFDPTKVAEWMLASGKTKRPAGAPSQVATTRSEAAQLLNVSTRTLAEWLRDPTFPGKAGGPGRQDGYFPITEIEVWRNGKLGGDGRSGGDAGELAELRVRKLKIEIDQKQVEFERECGSILDAEELARFQERHINTAKTLLEQLPDKVETLLPAALTPKLKARIRKVIEETVSETCNEIAQMMDGDEDAGDA